MATKEVDKESGLASVKAWLPEGEWLEYETGTMLKGGQNIERQFSMDEYPVYIKAGSSNPTQHLLIINVSWGRSYKLVCLFLTSFHSTGQKHL